jgi:hypothetical protein
MIGYKEQDQLVFNVSYGYKTMFAYYAERESGKVTEDTLKKNKVLGLKCG